MALLTFQGKQLENLELTLTLPQAVEVTNQVLRSCIAFSLCTLLGFGGFGGLINSSIRLPDGLRTIHTACCTSAPHTAELYAPKQACFRPWFCLNEATRLLLLGSSCTSKMRRSQLKQDWPQSCLAGADIAPNSS